MKTLFILRAYSGILKSIEDNNCGIRFNPNSEKEIFLSIKKAINMKKKQKMNFQKRCINLIKKIKKQNMLLKEKYSKLLLN